MSIQEVLLHSWHGGVNVAEDISWPPGAVSQLAVDEIALEATPRAWNNIFAIVGNRAVPRKREGCQTMNLTPVTGSPALIGQYDYRFRDPDTGVISYYHLLASENGRLDWMDTSGTLTTIDATAFTTGYHPPSFATLNNHAFIANGQEACKVYRETKQTWGITRPTVTSTTINAGAVGKLNGTYEIAFTFRNSTSGHESSRSDAVDDTVVCAGTKIDITGVPTTTDTQVDEVYIYLRNTTTQALFYKAGSVVEGVTTASIDVDTVDTDLIIPSPNTTENNPPPAGIRYLAVHKGRMFMATEGRLYWSKTGKPEAVDPTAWDYVNQDDGQKITGLVSLPGGYLLILKQDSYHILEGDTPGIWAISKIGPEVGCLAATSIVSGADAIYWWSEQGPVKLGFGALSTPELIGKKSLSAVIARRNLNYVRRDRICGTFHLGGQRVIWSVPEYAQPRNTRLLVWSSRLSQWESDRWDPMDVASLTTVEDAQSESFVMLGGYAGQVFKLGIGYSDGVPSGTMTGTFVAGATTHATITVAAAAFLNTGGKIIERKVTVLDDTGVVMTTGIRPFITANTGTVLTLSRAVSGLTVGDTYTVIVGGPDWQFDTSWVDAQEPFKKKRLLFLYIMGLLYGQTMYVDLLQNRKGFTLESTRLASIVGAGTLWNDADKTWNDGTLWNDAEVTYDRLRGARTGVSFAARCRNPYPNQSMILLKLGLSLEVGDDKLG